MTRMLMALAVAGVATAGSARADWGGYGPPPVPPGGYPAQPAGGTGEFNSPNTLTGMYAARANKAPDRYGLLPGLRKAFRLNDGGCDTCGGKHGLHAGGCGKGGCGPVGHGGGGYDPSAYGPNWGYPPVQQGTLVFPHHPYVRSPRDFFMYEPGK